MDSVIHIKATYEGEVRRFQCVPTFEILESSLRSLFACKPTDQILITFLDDENEYCRISCQIELEYAVTLPSPLRLVMKLVSPTKPVLSQVAEHPTPVANDVRARRLACNRERALEERLAMINSAMEQPNLPAHRLTNLSNRKDAIIAKLHGLPSSAPASSSPTTPFPQADVPHSCSERLQARLEMINNKLAQPDLPEHKLELLKRKKAFIEAKMADPSSVESGNRTQFWQMRLNHINAALEHPDLTPQRRENLTRKKEHLTAKLAGGNSNSSNPKMDKTQFWQMRLKHINDALAHPDLPAQRRENLTLKKKKIEEKMAACGQTPSAPQETPCNPWNRPHHFGWGPHHGGPHHHAPHGGPHHAWGCPPPPPHGFGFPAPPPHAFGCPPPPPHAFGFPPPPPEGAEPGAVGCPPPPHSAFGPHHGHHHPWSRGGPHHHHGHPGGWGAHGSRGHHLEAKLAWINQALEQPGLPAHKAAGLAQRKAMIEAKIAQKDSATPCEEKPERAELVALRGAVGTAKVNLKNARQSGLKDAELSPFIDAVANAKAALVKRRLELKSAGPHF